MLPQPEHRLTEEEYLQLDRAAETKSEFYDGEIFAMAGGTPVHSLIGTNLARECGIQLKGSPCVAYNSDLRIKVEASGLMTYPDLSVICGPLEYAPGTDDTVLNPSLLAEVLSDSTEAYDRGIKWSHYQRIPSLQTYLLVSQHQPRVEQFTRGAGAWAYADASGIESELEIPSLGIRIRLSEVFANVRFQENRLHRSPRST